VAWLNLIIQLQAYPGQELYWFSGNDLFERAG